MDRYRSVGCFMLFKTFAYAGLLPLDEFRARRDKMRDRLRHKLKKMNPTIADEFEFRAFIAVFFKGTPQIVYEAEKVSVCFFVSTASTISSLYHAALVIRGQVSLVS